MSGGSEQEPGRVSLAVSCAQLPEGAGWHGRRVRGGALQASLRDALAQSAVGLLWRILQLLIETADEEALERFIGDFPETSRPTSTIPTSTIRRRVRSVTAHSGLARKL